MTKQHQTRAFTIVEIMVAMGIIVILISILVPFISKSFRQATRFRSQADLQAIAQGLEAYKQDFGDIPRIPTDTNGVPLKNAGAAILCKAMIGPYGTAAIPAPNTQVPYSPGDAVFDGTKLWVTLHPLAAGSMPAYNADWLEFDANFLNDGLEGPGFRIRQGGKSYGPYLDPSKFKHQGIFLLDASGNPILYSPAKPGKSDVTKVPATDDPGPYVSFSKAGKPVPVYDALDLLAFFRRDGETPSTNTPPDGDDLFALARIQMMLGDYKTNGFIESAAQETAVTQPYLLWSSGPDGVFGPTGSKPVASGSSVTATDAENNRNAVRTCDDVTNFRE